MIKHIMHKFTRAGNKNSQNEVEDHKYVCPMHPEVKSSSPGNCPECGMFLKEVTSETKNKTTKKGSDHDEPAQKDGCC